jgi:putative ABC transport system permease protein
MLRRPAFALPCIAGLAIGIAASSAVFSAFSAIELESMGFADSGTLAAAATVVGIARPEFGFPRDVDLWIALRPSWPDVEKNATIGVFRSVARIAPRVSLPQVRARLDAALRQSDTERPVGTRQLDTLVKPLRDEAYGTARPAVTMLLAAVLLLLLIACANAANLTLALHAERAHEMAVRAALGAGRRRLVALLLAESATAAAAGGVTGLLLARSALRIIVRFAPPEMPAVDRIALHWPVVLFSLGLTAATVLLFGAGPALLATSAQTAVIAGLETRSGARPHRRLRGLLIAGEVALSAMLAIGAGLRARSFANLAAIDSGFPPGRHAHLPHHHGTFRSGIAPRALHRRMPIV